MWRARPPALIGNREHRDRGRFDVDLDEIPDQPTGGVGELFFGDVRRPLDQLQVVVGGGQRDAAIGALQPVSLDEEPEALLEFAGRCSREYFPGEDARPGIARLRDGDGGDLIGDPCEAHAGLRAAPATSQEPQSEHGSIFLPVVGRCLSLKRPSLVASPNSSRGAGAGSPVLHVGVGFDASGVNGSCV